MNNLNLENYLETKQVQTGPRSERDELVGKFVEEINRERAGTKYKQVDHAWFNAFLKRKVGRKMRNTELYSLYNHCKNYNGPLSKIFFGSFKEQSWKQST